MMDRSNLCSLAVLAVLAVFATVVAEEMYSDIFDHIDADEILKNDELRDQYYKCFMDTGPCVTEDQKYFKGILSSHINLDFDIDMILIQYFK